MNTTNGTQSTALAVAPVAAPLAAPASRALEPSDIATAYDLAKLLVAGRMIPAAIRSPEAALTIIMSGRELGLTAMQSLRSIYFFDGKLTMSADLMVALAKRSSVCKAIDLLESTDVVAIYNMQRNDDGKATRFSYSIDDAKRAGLTNKDNWRKYPRAMLRARCAAEGVRAMFPDVLLGVYETDEIGPSAQRIPEAEIVSQQADAWQAPAEIVTVETETKEPEAACVTRLAACASLADVDKLAADAGSRFHGEARARVAKAFADRRKALAPVEG